MTPRKFSRVKYSKSQYVNALTSPFDLRIGTLRETSSPNKSPDPVLNRKRNLIEVPEAVLGALEFTGNCLVTQTSCSGKRCHAFAECLFGVY